MDLKVEYQDGSGKTKNYEFNIGYLQFVKHLAFAGMGAHKSEYSWLRFLGFMFGYMPYWNSSPHHFQIPDIVKHDPTELGQISNRIGVALADYLAKRICGAKYTHNYEDVMVLHGYPVKGKRPDLYCDTLKEQFSIEAKGYKRRWVSSKDMLGYKSQSKKGPIPVNFSVASVAYALYREPKVKFHDPVEEGVEYSKDINKKLVSSYYQSVLDSIERFGWEPIYQDQRIPKGFVAYEVMLGYSAGAFYLLLHESIIEGLTLSGSFKLERDHGDLNVYDEFTELESNTYVDVDGIGLCFRKELLRREH